MVKLEERIQILVIDNANDASLLEQLQVSDRSSSLSRASLNWDDELSNDVAAGDHRRSRAD